MTEQTLPTIGAALQIKNLAHYRDWLIAEQRDLEIQDACVPDVLDGDWQPLVTRVRDALDGYQGRMGIHGPFMSLNLLAIDPKIRAVVSERMLQALEFGAELGATHMVIHSPYLFFGTPFLAGAATNRSFDDIGIVHATLEAAVKRAGEIGCTLVIENITDSNPAALLDLIRSFDSSHVRMSLDTGHAAIPQQRGGPTPDQWVREAGSLLEHVHVQDSDGHYDRHWAPGDGSIGWYALFEALATLEQQPRLVLELRDQTKIMRGYEWLRDRGFVR